MNCTRNNEKFYHPHRKVQRHSYIKSSIYSSSAKKNFQKMFQLLTANSMTFAYSHKIFALYFS